MLGNRAGIVFSAVQRPNQSPAHSNWTKTSLRARAIELGSAKARVVTANDGLVRFPLVDEGIQIERVWWGRDEPPNRPGH